MEQKTREPFWVTGVEWALPKDPTREFFERLWSQGYMPRDGDVASGSLDKLYYCVYHTTGEYGPEHVVAGMRTPKPVTISIGLVVREVSAPSYLMESCEVCDIARCWERLQAASGPETNFRPSGSAFEVFRIEPHAPVECWLGVSPR